MLLDIAARRMGIDPVELRRRNLLRRDELPYTNPNGMTYDNISPLETFEQALEMLDYDAFRARAGRGARGAAATSASASSQLRRAVDARLRRTTAPRRATIRIEPSGTVNVYIAGGSTGNSIETTVVQLTADALGVDIDDVAHDPGRHRGHRLRRGHGREPQRLDDRGRGRARPPTILRERIVAIAAHQLEAAADDIELADEPGDRARHARRSASRSREIAALAYFEPAVAAARRPGRARGERALHRRRAGRSG